MLHVVKKQSSAELRSDLCSMRIVGEGDTRVTCSHPESSGPVKKGQNSGITVDDHKRLKSQTRNP
jgi:hypothetical protein